MDELTHASLLAGRYAIRRPLGTGATKQVYLADDLVTGGEVALSLLVRRSDDEVEARFAREARIGTLLRSPYIVHVFDDGVLDDGTRYLATEAVLGRGLDDALLRGAVATENAARWTVHVLAALSLAHEQGIVHRDIKPENVLLARTTEGEIAKLADFGIAKLLDSRIEPTPTVRTQADHVLGTPHYMSPEQWTAEGLDARADLYSVGAMLYELLIGRTPFENAASLHAMCSAHLYESPPPFPDDAPAAVRAFEPIVMRALEKQASDRFATAVAMREAVEAVSGYRLASEPATFEAVLPAPFARAELSSEIWHAPIQIIATPAVVLGRSEQAHIAIRCVPETAEGASRTKTISREHARIEWRGGQASITDLGSHAGTSVNGQRVGREGVALLDGDEIALGPHVRMNFQRGPSRAGSLPRWARIVRTDEYGADQLYVLVLTEARIAASADAAIPVPAYVAGDDLIRIRASRDGLCVIEPGSAGPRTFAASDVLRVGDLAITVTLR